MKKYIFSLSAAIISVACLLGTGCKGEDGTITYEEPEHKAASVSINIVSVKSSGEVVINFKPNEETTRTKYGVGTAEDRESFIAGTLDGIGNEDGSVEFTKTFSRADDDRDYLIYAQAYGNENESGAISTAAIPTIIGEFSVAEQFVGDESASFVIEFSSDHYRFDYYLGTEDDKEAFANGTLEGIVSKYDEVKYTQIYFDLEPETEYVLFTRGYNRYGTDTGVMVHNVKTKAKDACPGVEYTPGHIDVYRSEFDFEMNPLCSKLVIVYLAADDNVMNAQLYANNGDMLGTIVNWVNVNANRSYVVTEEKNYVFNYNPDKKLMVPEHAVEMYIVTYDNDGEPFGIIKRQSSAPEFDPAAVETQVEVSIDTVTATTVDFSVEVTDNALGYFYDVFPAYSIDSGAITAERLQVLVVSSKWYYLREGNVLDDLSVTLPTNRVNREFYLIVYPVNQNGIEGWGEYYVEKFTAPS